MLKIFLIFLLFTSGCTHTFIRPPMELKLEELKVVPEKKNIAHYV